MFRGRSGRKAAPFRFLHHSKPLAAKIDLKQITADFILVSHGHGDQAADVVELARQTGAKLIAPYEVGSWFVSQGVENVQAMNHGGAARTSFGRVKLTAAIHSSSMPDGSYGGNPAGFLVETKDGNFYYSGDTALTSDMKLIADETELRFAVLPIGDFFTMGIKDAVRAADFVGANKIVGVHYNTFPPIKLDRAGAMKAASTAGRELLLPQIGETIDL